MEQDSPAYNQPGPIFGACAGGALPLQKNRRESGFLLQQRHRSGKTIDDPDNFPIKKGVTMR